MMRRALWMGVAIMMWWVSSLEAVCMGGDPRTKFITSPADWADINSASFDIFCVQPGDYSSMGVITITADGTPSVRRRLLYHNPSNPGDPTHPANMAAPDRAIIKALLLSDADYWDIEQLTIDGAHDTGETYYAVLEIAAGSSNNLIFKNTVERSKSRQIAIRDNNSNDNIIRQNVIRNSLLVAGDLIGVVLITFVASGNISGTIIEDNEIYDNSQAIQFVTGTITTGSTFPNSIVRNNDMYVTSARYTDCAGNFTPTGPCMAGESIVVFKGGGTNSTDYIQMVDNRLWGSRRADPNYGAPGGFGEPILFQGESKFTLVQDNFIWDSARGIQFAVDATRISAIGNVLYNIQDLQPNTGQVLLSLLPSLSNEMYNNVVVDSYQWSTSTADNLDMRCNTALDSPTEAGTSGAGSTVDYNFYYNAPQRAEPGTNDIIRSTSAESNNVQICFQRQLITNPNQFCIPLAGMTTASPHNGQCDPNLGSRTGIGIDDRLWPPPQPVDVSAESSLHNGRLVNGSLRQ